MPPDGIFSGQLGAANAMPNGMCGRGAKQTSTWPQRSHRVRRTRAQVAICCAMLMLLSSQRDSVQTKMMLGGANANLSVDAKLREILGPDAMTPPRAVKVDVDPAGEILVLAGEVKAEPMEPSAVFEAVSELLEDSVPCLVLLSLHGLCETSKEKDYAMIAWTPDVSPVKLRMLCASSRRTLREEFTHLHFKEYNTTERREVTWEQYQESTRARTEQDRFAAMTQDVLAAGDEIDQLEVRKQVAKEQAMAPKKLAGLAGMQVKVNETFESSMKRFLESSERLQTLQTLPHLPRPFFQPHSMTLRRVLLALPILQALGDCSDESCAVKDRSLLQKHAMAGMSKADDLSEIERPPRIFQHFIPEPPEPSETIVGTDPGVCEKDIFARKDLCPQQCPFAAEMESKFCHFRCVSKMQCGDPSTGTLRNASIPDEKMHLCRHCQVEACQTCKAGPPGASGAALERCVKCFPGYTLTAEGECEMKGEGFFVAIGVVGAIAVVVAAAWYLSEGISEGMEGQNRAMLTMPTQPGEEARPYPLSTNLLTTNVAGTGTMLFFRFQFALFL
eukprot:s1190_g1.t1